MTSIDLSNVHELVDKHRHERGEIIAVLEAIQATGLAPIGDGRDVDI